MTWIKCTDKVPEDNHTRLIVRLTNPLCITKANGWFVHNLLFLYGIKQVWWMPYSEEQWLKMENIDYVNKLEKV